MRIASRLAPLALALALAFPPAADCYSSRRELRLPVLPGYAATLACDFHMHTVFSDGLVWPTVRVEEAWREGLDAFAITDHLEYQKHKADVRKAHNQPWELSRPVSVWLGMIQVRGSEITKRLPPGHFNAIFLRDSEPVENENYLESIRLAVEQGAFVFWNHPYFQQKDELAVWSPEQTAVMERGWMHGIELVNGDTYCAEAHRWALEKKLTMLGSSDEHNAIGMSYDFARGEHRPLTLIFAGARSEEALKEALFAHRTVVWGMDGRVFGEQEWLDKLFAAAVSVENPELELKGWGSAALRLRNPTDLTFVLALDGPSPEGLRLPKRLTVPPGAVALLEIGATAGEREGVAELVLPYRVENLLPAPDQALRVEFPVRVRFVPASPPPKKY